MDNRYQHCLRTPNCQTHLLLLSRWYKSADFLHDVFNLVVDLWIVQFFFDN